MDMLKQLKLLGLCLLIGAVLCACGQSSPSAEQSVPSASAEDTSAGQAIQQDGGQTDERLAAQWLIQPEHEAFRAGRFLVTAQGRQSQGEFGYEVTLCVWDPENMDEPLQTMTKDMEAPLFGIYQVVDANFDGAEDFGWLYFMGNQPAYWYYWIWNEEQGKFVEEPAFSVSDTAVGGISDPTFDSLNQTVTGFARSSGFGTGEWTVHQWVEGSLVLMRRITVDCLDWSDPAQGLSLVVEEPVNGALSETYRQEGGAQLYEQGERWLDLNYHGET